MIDVALLSPTGAYAPEVIALQEYLTSQTGFRATVINDERDLQRSEYSLLYRLMGIAPRWRRARTAEFHDYASLSVGAGAWLKDRIKPALTRRPVLRSFLNEKVQQHYQFSDGVPALTRDMGVPTTFRPIHERRSVEFDFLYAGTLSRKRKTLEMTAAIVKAGYTILLVGEPDADTADFAGRHPQVRLAGRVRQIDLPTLASTCRFGLNYTPNVYPFNFQTSTKVLEYCALGLPVVTNRYSWVEECMRTTGGRFYTYDRMDQISRNDIERFDFLIPNMSEYTWPRVFRRSGVAEAITLALTKSI